MSSFFDLPKSQFNCVLAPLLAGTQKTLGTSSISDHPNRIAWETLEVLNKVREVTQQFTMLFSSVVEIISTKF